MLKFPIKILLAILLSPALTTPLAAEQNNLKDTKKIIVAQTTTGTEVLSVKDRIKLKLESDALEKQAIEKSLSAAELTGKPIQVNKEMSEQSTTNPNTTETTKESELSSLINMEQFKVCSLGHNYNINKMEFIKHSQVTQAATIMKFTGGSNPNYKCEIMVISEDKQDVTLKCWSGSKYNDSVSTFKLSYFFNQGYLFSQKNKSKLVFIKPILNNQPNICPNNFKPVASNKSGDKENSEESEEGLAGLTF